MEDDPRTQLARLITRVYHREVIRRVASRRDLGLLEEMEEEAADRQFAGEMAVRLRKKEPELRRRVNRLSQLLKQTPWLYSRTDSRFSTSFIFQRPGPELDVLIDLLEETGWKIKRRYSQDVLVSMQLGPLNASIEALRGNAEKLRIEIKGAQDFYDPRGGRGRFL